MKSKKQLLNLAVVFVISVLMSSLISRRPDGAFLNTIYTIAGIMFSIGMGLLCTLNPDKIKNQSVYFQLKSNIIDVRNIYITYFSVISAVYLAYQIFPDFSFAIEILTIKICFELTYLTAMLNILSILYFILNFIEMQRLNFDIYEKAR